MVQNLKQVIENRLREMMKRNPLRTNLQLYYEQIVAEYNRKKDRVTIEHTFETLFRFEQGIDEEERRAVREGLNEESLAIFDLLRKPDLSSKEIKQIKQEAVEFLRECLEKK